jgi:3-oxoacyl-[acyl-carrier protein] reductase
MATKTQKKAGLQGRVALVTGASRGIGAAIARALADAGADLALLSTRKGGCDAALRHARGAGVRAEAWACNISKPKELDRVLREVKEKLGAVEVLVNNAGTVFYKRFVDTSDAAIDQTLAVNLAAQCYLARRVLPSMLKKKWGRIVNISSISATMGTPKLTAYCASKWGVNGFTKALASELTGTGVTATAVMPGSTDTEMLAQLGFKPNMKPEEIAEVVRYLCAEAPASMNGALVEVFGP